jgi:hypothetical protein
MRVRGTPRLLLVNVVVFAALATVVEGTSSFIRHAWSLTRDPGSSEPEPYIRHDDDLGWSLRPGTVISVPGAPAPLHVNRRGFRSPRELADATAGRVRVACSGDSFTFGDGVADADTWCAQLESADPALESVNLGVPGYGVDQMYLRYQREAPDLQAAVHVFAFIDDDFRRMGTSRDKPWLTAADERLTVHNVPVPAFQRPSRVTAALEDLNTYQLAASIGSRLRHAGAAPPAGPADGVLAAIAAGLAATGQARHTAQIVVRLPSFDPPSPYAAVFLAAARRASLTVVDLRARLAELPATAPWVFFLDGREPGSHPNAAGHGWIARELGAAIGDTGTQKKPAGI